MEFLHVVLIFSSNSTLLLSLTAVRQRLNNMFPTCSQ